MIFHRLFTAILLLSLVAQTVLADEIKIMGQNVQNFFYSLDRGRTKNNYVTMSNYSDEQGRTKKLNAICSTLSRYNADVYAFNEVECCDEVMELLAQCMSDYTGCRYRHVSDRLTYDKNGYPNGCIKSAFIYNSETIEPIGDNLSVASGYTHEYPERMRMQTFESKTSGERFTLCMNHFKASTSDDPEYDINRREENSIALLKGLAQTMWDPEIIVMGDLNTVMGEQCLNNLVDAGYEEQILRYEGETAASYWFNEDGSLIDHIFANSTMAAQVTDARMLYVANPHSTGNRYTAYSDHDPYLLTLNLKTQPEPSYSYKKVTEIQPGTHYIMTALINGNLNVANSVSSGRYYEYQTTTVVKEYNGKITMTDPKSAFIFEENGNGTYLIKDYFGRYVYQYRADNSSYYSNSVNVGSKMYAHAFSVTPQANGTFKILNTLSNCYYQGQIYNGTNEFGLFSDTHNSRYMPMLYEYDATATGITMVNVYDEPTKTRKVMINGNIIIVKPDGIQCTLQGVIHR